MADKNPSLFDAEIQAVLRATAANREDQKLRESIEAARAADPLYYNANREAVSDFYDNRYNETAAHLEDLRNNADGRSLGEHVQDVGTGLMGTFGAIGSTADLAIQAIADSLTNVPAAFTEDEATWDRTAGALQRMNSTGEFWNDLQSEKSAGFDRISQYRQKQAVDQLNEQAFAETGTLADPVDRMMAEFESAVGTYAGDPGQILTDGVAQLPYLLTGGVAKGITSGTKLANPLISRMVAKGMTQESAEKLVQMGIVGGLQGTIEGSDAASSAYTRVMASDGTFYEDDGKREAAALEAAATAFSIAAPVSALTGMLTSKFELSPFSAAGGSAAARTGDNLIKALQEGIQETIESGVSQAATNYAGNEVLANGDDVFLDQGVGGAAGTGFVVGTGSTTITNPGSLLDAAQTPLVLAGKGVGYLGGRAVEAERDEDMAAAGKVVDSLLATAAASPVVAQAVNAASPVTTDTPAELVELPAEINTTSPLHLFATGMEYLKGKDMDSEDAVTAFHVLGAVMESAVVARNTRDNLQLLAQDPDATVEDRAAAQKELTKLESLIDEDKLNAWVDEMPMDQIDGYLDQLQQNPVEFGSTVAQLAAYNPMKVSSKMLEAAYQSKGLKPAQRDSIKLAQELKQAEDELKVGVAPDSSEVSRSIMQTGFPGANNKLSIAEMLRNVTSSLEQGDTESGQIYFNKLVSFSKYLANRAARFEQTKTELANSPDVPYLDVPMTGTWDKTTGKYEKAVPFKLRPVAASLAVVGAVRKDADVVAKMVAAVHKRTGLTMGGQQADAQQDPVAAPETAKKATPKVEAPVAAAKAETAPVAAVVDKTDPGNLTDLELDQEIVKVIGSRKAADKFQLDVLTRERDRRIADGLPSSSDRVVGKSVQNTAPSQPEPVVAPVDIVVEDAPVNLEKVEEEFIAAPLAGSTPSKNQYTDLMPDYVPADGASVAEQNDAKNHLAQSFTTSEQPGLVSKLPETIDALLADLGLTGRDAEAATGVFQFKDQILGRLDEMLAKKFPKTRRLAMLKGQNFWKEPNAHSLYATVWDENGIAYDPVIAQVMSWTGVQHMLDMIYPVSWSADKQAAFLATYGDAILPLLQDGWVPLADQVHQVATKLQANLELTPDTSVSLEYTEGTMLALAMDTIGVMVSDRDYDGPFLTQQVATLAGPKVQWMKVGVADPDVLHDAARALDGFFPERASTAAGIVGEKPTSVNPMYRGSRQKIGKNQQKALLKMSQTAHKLSPLMLKLWQSLPNEAGLRLFGFKPVEQVNSLAEIAQDGANKTLIGDMRTIGAHIRAVENYISQQEEETALTDVPSYFPYEMVVNGRAMTKGTSPQSSKFYRELFSTVQRTIDPSQDNRNFLMAVAQGFGSKMDKRPVQESLDWLTSELAKPEVQRALEAVSRLTNGDMAQMDADLTAIEQSGIEMSPHALSAMVHMAEYQKGQPFVSSLSYEIDGLTDGPINLMMLLGLEGSAPQMEHWLGLGGLWFGESKIAVQDKLDQLKDWFNGSKDLYEIIADRASALNNEQAQAILDSVPEAQQKDAKRMLQAILHLMHITKLSQSNLQELTAKHSRSFTKKPTQAAGYQQGPRSIVNDLANTMLEALSERIDSDKMTDGDWAAVDVLLGDKLVYSKTKKQYFLYKDVDEFKGLEWDGAPLNKKQFDAVVGTLMNFGGAGLANATIQTIGFQREHMSAAVDLVNAHIRYAQDTLQKAYKAKQDVEVEAGRLHPNQALSKRDEQALIKQVWENIIPHPMLRNTGGLPSASTNRSGVPVQNVRRVQGALFDRQNLQVSEASFEDPGVSFAALSIMAAGDGSMMTGFFANNEGNHLNMFDGIYIDPSDIDAVGEGINKEVKRNWEHDFIGAVLDSLKLKDPEFRAWAEQQMVGEDSLLSVVDSAAKRLEAQRQQQVHVVRDINAWDHSVSHMAGHNNPHFQSGVALDSTTIGTTKTDPLLDLASEGLGTTANGIRKMTKSDVVALLKDHTFENPVLSGLWRVLAPLVSDNLTVFMSTDRQALGEFYQQNERRSMSSDVDGTSIGDRVYVRSINAEVIMHELLHATTKSLTATFFAKPAALTAQQRDAMTNLVALMDEFMDLDTESLPSHQRAMVEHVQAIMSGYSNRGDTNSALQEFLAYGLSNYHLQRTLGNTKSALAKLVESVFTAVKKLFGFPAGAQSDSMLAQMLSNFETLTTDAAGVVYPISVETALEAVNPNLARSFGDVLARLEQRSATITQSVASRNLGRTRMQELADTGLFNLTDEQQKAAEYVQAIFAAGLRFKPDVNAVLQRVVDGIRAAGPGKVLDAAQFEFFFSNQTPRAKGEKYIDDRAADILALSLVSPEFNAKLVAMKLPREAINKDSLNEAMDSGANALFAWADTGLGIGKDASLSEALDVAALRLRKSLMDSVKRQQAKPGMYRRVTEKLSEGVQLIGEMAGKTADARQQLTGNKNWISSGLSILAGMTNDRYADMMGKTVLSLTNHMEAAIPLRETIQEMVGTVGDNFKLIQMKGIAARMISAIRQTFREQVPVTVKSWFKDLSNEQDTLLHKVIGQYAVYSLSQSMKDRMVEVLTDPTNALLDAQTLLMSSGNRGKRALMVKYAKHLGDYMADKGTNAVYRNTRAIAGLEVHGGGDSLTTAEMATLEDLSTLQALTHLSKVDRAMALDLVRNQPEAFWKTTALIHSFQQLDTRRAGEDTATLNFQKGWIPVETDGRKKVRLVSLAEVKKAERMGWVQVGVHEVEPGMVYMATTVGKTPTLSGGAIHSVDMHMNGIHFHSGLPVLPGVQTLITTPSAVSTIQAMLQSGKEMPYTALYDAAGDVVGFQRILNPEVVARHTRDVRRVSDAAGIWLGRLHEEQAAHGQNKAAADLLATTWQEAPAERKVEFVNIRDTKDKVLSNIWKSLPYMTKVQLENAFANGSKDPPIMIRRDQLNDAVGYHKASVGNFFTGDNRYQQKTNDSMAAFARQLPFLGKNAYKYLVLAEEGWQGVISSAKDTIIVKSLVVALNNLASNQTQLFMITGNPVWNIRVQTQKYKEVHSYLGYQQRVAQLTAEGLVAAPARKKLIDAEQVQLKLAMRKLSIHPLIEAGEMPSIAEGLSETEEFSLVGDFTEWAEKQLGKMPPMVGTVIDNLAVAKHTSLYKGLDRLVQYGDFVAKATMYEWLTTQDAKAKQKAEEMIANDTSKTLKMADALHTVALMEVNDEFVNYARLPGRWRTYGEDMGMLWFFNYKLRIMKMIFRRMRANPAAFLIGAQAGGMLGVETLIGNLPWNLNLDYATGIDPLFTAHQSILWNQML